MALVKCPAYGTEGSGLVAEAAHAARAQPTPRQRRERHAVTWVAVAVIIPLLCWDAWQTRHEIQQRRQASMQHANPSPAVWAAWNRLRD